MLNFTCVAKCISKGGKELYYTFVEHIGVSNNLCALWFLNGQTPFRGPNNDMFKVHTVQYCTSMKRAIALSLLWDESFSKNGTSYFEFLRAEAETAEEAAQ